MAVVDGICWAAWTGLQLLVGVPLNCPAGGGGMLNLGEGEGEGVRGLPSLRGGLGVPGLTAGPLMAGGERAALPNIRLAGLAGLADVRGENLRMAGLAEMLLLLLVTGALAISSFTSSPTFSAASCISSNFIFFSLTSTFCSFTSVTEIL